VSAAAPRRRFVGRAVGRVQGVGYRSFCVDEATRMQLVGYARNLGNGRSVEVVAEGDEPTLRLFIERLREGPMLAMVDDVEYRWEDPEEDLVGFEARF